ncbi:MAG: hypothetical protein ACXVB9_13450 [Bdellovibrionota bacterium]
MCKFLPYFVCALMFVALVSSNPAEAKSKAPEWQGVLGCRSSDDGFNGGIFAALSADRSTMTVQLGYSGKPKQYKAKKTSDDNKDFVTYETSSWLDKPYVLRIDHDEPGVFYNSGLTLDEGDVVAMRCQLPDGASSEIRN